MRIALAQLDFTIGDFEGNLEKLAAADRSAASEHASMIVFPEMAVTGYPPKDLLEDPGFVAAAEEAVKEFARNQQTTWAVVGGIRHRRQSFGRPLENCAFLLYKGEVKAIRSKTLLPSYDVFDEERYFEPAARNRPLSVLGKKLGITVCEDLWADLHYAGHKRYGKDPVANLARSGMDLLVNIAASPFERGKGVIRDRLAIETARKRSCHVVMVNQVGGNDELVFDGRSLVVDPSGRIMARVPEFDEAVLTVDLETSSTEIQEPAPPMPEVESVRAALVLGIKDYCLKCGFHSVVIGLSGGIDSAVTAVLAAQAMGRSNVLGITMPSVYSSKGSVEDSRKLAENLGIEFKIVPIAGELEAFRSELSSHLGPVERTLVEENLQARIRGTILMAFANAGKSLVLATGNKSELATGYCTLYGDMVGGLAPLSDLPKTKVYELAEHLNREFEVIPREIMEKPPSAELAPGQRDTDSLPPYEMLDRVLSVYLDKLSASVEPLDDVPEQVVSRVVRMLDRAEYKRRQAPPGLKVSGKAFGSGRRIPIAQRFKRS